jgi:hypothetical protein
MAESYPTSGFSIEYANDDPVVKRYLEKASLYRYLTWMNLGLLGLNGLTGVVENSGRLGSLAALLGAGTAICAVLESGFRKSAWIRTLELRLDELRRSSSPPS